MQYTPQALLDAIVEDLTEEKGELVVSTWFGNATAVAIHDDTLIIHVPTALGCETLKARFTENVSAIMRKYTGEPMIPLYITGQAELLRWQNLVGEVNSQDYTFENFVVGNSNRFAFAAATNVAREPARSYNPLVIYGYSGLGKTHLLHSIAYEVKKNNPHFIITYTKGDEFTNELVESIGRGTMSDFRARYRMSDLLLVDDIQFIAGKERTQEEFFHTFNALYEAGKQIVITSDRPPKDMHTLEDRLRSRFEWGLLADVQAPDLEMRVVLVQAKARRMGIDLPQDVVEYIAALITSNVRQLEGTVKKIAAVHSMLNRPVNLELAKYAINEVFRENPGITPEIIARATCEYFNVPIEKIMGNYKMAEYVTARQTAVYLIREMTEMSLPEIGRFINRDHATVLYSIKKVDERMGRDPQYLAAVKDIRQTIESR